MAMSNPAQTYGFLSTLVDEVKQDQKPTKKKANTVVTGIGAVATAVVVGILYFLEQGTALPDWSPWAAMVLGLVGQVGAVNRTKNGVTDSVAEQLNAALNKRIDDAHELGHAEAPAPEPVEPTPIGRAGEALETASDVAQRLDEITKRLAARRE